MLYNYFEHGRYRVQIITRLCFVCSIWLIALTYKSFSQDHSNLYFIEQYILFYVFFALLGYLFCLYVANAIFVLWRLLFEAILCIFWVSLPIEIILKNEWWFIGSLLLAGGIFYSFIYSLRFFYWSEFENSLKKFEKLKERSGKIFFYFQVKGYDEIYNFDEKFSWLRFFCFWEHSFFSKEIDLRKKAVARAAYKILFLLTLVAIVVDLLSNFDAIGFVIVISLSLVIPAMFRVSIAPALLDVVVSFMYPNGDKIKF